MARWGVQGSQQLLFKDPEATKISISHAVSVVLLDVLDQQYHRITFHQLVDEDLKNLIIAKLV